MLGMMVAMMFEKSPLLDHKCYTPRGGSISSARPPARAPTSIQGMVCRSEIRTEVDEALVLVLEHRYSNQTLSFYRGQS